MSIAVLIIAVLVVKWSLFGYAAWLWHKDPLNRWR